MPLKLRLKGIVPGTGLTLGHPDTPTRGVTKTYAAPRLVFSFCPFSKASFAHVQNEKTSSILSRRFLCPGLYYRLPERQYLVCQVCQI